MITLNCGLWQAEIAPEYGMNTCSLKYDGKELLRRAPDPAVYAEDPCVWGIPTLLPPNRTADGTFTFEGKTYKLEINEPKNHNHLHGYLHRSAFRVTARTAASVSGVYENRGGIFPLPFAVEAGLTLDAEGYRMAFTVKNTGETDFPLTFALHANFREPERFSVPLGQRWECSDRAIPTGKLVGLTEREKTWCAGTKPEGAIGGFFRSEGTSARLDGFTWRVSENFNQWILWNMSGGKGFLSLEPQCGAVNALNTGEGMLVLRPGESETFRAELLRREDGAGA